MNKLLSILSLLLMVSLIACNDAVQGDKTAAAVDSATSAQGVDADTAKANLSDSSNRVSSLQSDSNTSSPQIAELIKTKLQEQYKDDLWKNLIDSFSRRFAFFTQDLNNDNEKEIFVGFTGPYFCGTGGCSFKILNSKGDLITHFTVSEFPVTIENTTTKGWKDLTVKSGSKYHILKFDGKKYPSNPGTAPVFSQTPADNLPRALNNLKEATAWFRF